MIIFSHIQKTAGTSLRLDIESGCAGKYFSDYLSDFVLSYKDNFKKDRTIFKENVKNNAKDLINYDIIYGHFCSDKYNCLKDLTTINLITFMRDPIERVISHYYYWKNRVEINDFSDKHCEAYYQLGLLRENKLSLVEFADTEGIKNIYKLYFSSNLISDFAFIGIAERFYESIGILNNRFNTKFTFRKDNITDKSIYIDEIKYSYDKLNKINEENYHYYNLALNTFWNK